MSHPLITRKIDFISAVNFAATGDTILLTPISPIDIVRWGILSTVLIDVGAGMVVSLDHRPTIGSDTGRVEIAKITRTTDLAVGSALYQNIVTADADGETAEDLTTRYVAPLGPFQVNPGEQVVFDVDDAADTAGTGIVWIEYLEHPFVGTRIANATAVAQEV